jgi:predicted Fe-Mo cluster-binding NifX family protein
LLFQSIKRPFLDDLFAAKRSEPAAGTTADFPSRHCAPPAPRTSGDLFIWFLTETVGSANAVIRVAIPIFKRRVSPVFDACTRVLFVDIEDDREVDRKEIYLNALSLTDRIKILSKSKVAAVVCGGISELMETMLSSAGIDLISDITGEVDQVLAAYLTRGLDDPCFHLPGLQADPRPQSIHAKEKGHERS